jgi:lysophospholipase L1-like esterase
MANYDEEDKTPKSQPRQFDSHDLLEQEKHSLAHSSGSGSSSNAPNKTQSSASKTGSNQDQASGSNVNVNSSGNGSASTSSSSSASSPNSLKAAETNQGQPEDTLGKGFTGGKDAVGKTGKAKTKRLTRIFAGKNSKTVALVGGGVMGVVTLVLVGLFALIPLKIESLITDITSHFMASTDNAIQNESDTMLRQYFSKYVGPAVKICGSTINKDCRVTVTGGSNPVTSLYRTFSQNKLELTLADKYGIELSYVKHQNGGTYYLKAPGTTNATAEGDAISVGNGSQGIDSSLLGNEMSRNEVRTAVNDALSSESHWPAVFTKFKYGRLLEEKYGIKRCVVFCGTRDAFADKVSQSKYAFKSFMLERVIQPRSAALGSIFDCLLNNKCNQAASGGETCAEGTDCAELSQLPQDVGDQDIAAALKSASAGFGSETAASLIKTISDAREAGGFSSYILSQTINKIFSTDISADSIPAVGELMMVNQATNLVAAAGNGSTTLKKVSYAVDAAAAVSMYMMYQSFADELKTGHDSAAEIGSFTSSLGSGNQCDVSLEGSCPVKGIDGTAGAEQTPLYQALINGKSPTPASATGTTATLSLLGTAYADASNGAVNDNGGSTYNCNDGSAVPAGSLVCPEEILGGSNKYVSYLSSYLRSSGLYDLAIAFNSTAGKVISLIGDVITQIASGALGFAESVLEHLPGASGLITGIKNDVTGGINSGIDLLVNKLVPSPTPSPDESGGRNFGVIAAGADAAGSASGQSAIGGQRLTSKDVAAIDNQQTKEAEQSFKQESFFARIFDTNTPYSLVSRLAMDIPLGSKGSIIHQAASDIINNPFTGLFHGLASVFNHSNTTFAAGNLVDDPFGVTQYGYPSGAIPPDPQAYWDQNCTTDSALQKYNAQAASQADANGNPLNTTVDPCLLIQSTVGSVGGYYNSNLLSADDLADSSGNGSSPTTTSSTNANYYQLGDSISVGMSDGGLAADLAKGNWNVSKIEANTGYSIEGSMPFVQNADTNIDKTDVSNAGVIVIELGTNDIYDNQSQIATAIQNMVNAIKAINSTAQIYWVNSYSTLLPAYKTVNAAIAQEATSLGYAVLDWASEAINNPSLFDFNSSDGLGVHQATVAGYQAMSNWLAGQIGQAPTTQSADLVRNLLNASSSPSLGSKFADVFKSFDNLFSSPIKLKSLGVGK